MPLAPGTRIGAYEIVAVIGAGGMGEVYRARDAKLNRDVAVKVLPESVAGDEDRIARFTREAQTLAALNHPNIAGIYGFESGALILELVEGEELSALIARGPLPISDALPLARQIADALEAAHEQGIVHRDLKPANVKVRADGTVKVLDFGLAKVLNPDSAASAADAIKSPTLTARATQVGVVLGTAAYMAPEQAKGKPVDKRADIWAFGVVLYEMLSGRRAFEGEDISTTLAAVLMRDPEWSSLPNDMPRELRTLIRRCLERDPKTRLRDIGEARVILSDPETLRVPPPAVPPAVPARGARQRWTLFSIGIVAAALGGAWAARFLAPAPAQPAQIRLSVATPDVRSALQFDLSPDGRLLAFVARPANSTRRVLWVRPLAALEARVLPGTEGASGPFWAPDSKRLGFVAEEKLKTIDVTGGPPQTVCDAAGRTFGATWSHQGTIVFAQSSSDIDSTLVRVSDRGGLPSELLKPDAAQQQTALLWPEFLPDGRHFLYLASGSIPDERTVLVGSLDGGAPRMVLKSSTQVVFAAPRTLLYLRDGALMAQPFDTKRMRVVGEAQRVAGSVMQNQDLGRAAFAASHRGVLAFREAMSGDSVSDLAWVGRSGQALGSVGDPGPYSQIRLSPDERRVVVCLSERNTPVGSLWTLDFDNKIMSQSTFEEKTVADPLWAPDGRSVAFVSERQSRNDFYRQVVGSRTATLLFESPDDIKWLDDWSRDGRFLLFHLPKPGKLYSLSLTGKPEAALLAESRETFDGAHFSPDGRWVAYQSDESGQYEVWVASFPAFDRARRVSLHGGGQAFWRGDGRELFYLTRDGKMMSVPVSSGTSGSDINFRAPVELFQSPIPRPRLVLDEYAVTRDGQRFLFIQPRDQENAVPPITVVVNWTTGLTTD